MRRLRRILKNILTSGWGLFRNPVFYIIGGFLLIPQTADRLLESTIHPYFGLEIGWGMVPQVLFSVAVAFSLWLAMVVAYVVIAEDSSLANCD